MVLHLGLRSAFHALMLLGMSSTIGPNLYAQDTRPSQLTLKQIYDGATAARQPLDAISVKYTYTTRAVGGDPPEGGRVAIGTWDVVFAFKGEQRISAETVRVPKSESPEVGRTYIFDGEIGYSYRPGSLILFDGKVPNSEQSDTYCEEVLDIPVTDAARSRLDSSWFYPHCLRPDNPAPDFQKYVVLPEQEQVDGAWCHVVDCAGRQKLWVDPQLGFTLRRKAMYQPGGQFLAEYSFGRLTEVAKGLWLPLQCERLTNPFGVNGLKLATVIDVKEIAVMNQVTDDAFNIDLAPGTIVTGLGRGFVVQGDRTSLLDLIAGDLARARKDGPTLLWWILASAVIGVILLAIAFRQRRRTVVPDDGKVTG